MASSAIEVAALGNAMSCHERHNRSAVEAARHLLAHIDEAAKSHEKLMESSRQYCTDAVLAEQQSAAIPVLASFSSYCERSVGVYKMFGDCLSVNTVDQLRVIRKTNQAAFDDAMKSYKSTEQEVGKKDKKLKDIENSKSAANQRSAIDTLSRQLQDERKALGSMRENVVLVGQRCVSEHEKGSKAAILNFLHSTISHHAAMLQLATDAYQEVSKLP